MPDPFDPRLNCAAEICCAPAAASTTDASADRLTAGGGASDRAQVAILTAAGVSAANAPRVAAKLREMGLAFTSRELNAAIRRIVQTNSAEFTDAG